MGCPGDEKTLVTGNGDWSDLGNTECGERTEMQKDEAIVKKLLDFGKEIDPRELFPSLEPGATNFALSDPYAFSMATSLDRGTNAEIFWTEWGAGEGSLGRDDWM